jgi:hypothetical protein
VLLVVVLVGLLVGNLWSLQDLRKRIAAQPSAPPPQKAQPEETEPGRDRFLAALENLVDPGGTSGADQAALLSRYKSLVQAHKDLRVRDDDVRAQRTVAAISILAQRSPQRIEETVRRGLTGKGFSDHVIKAACDHVREQFATMP